MIPDDETGFPASFRIGAVADLNGDGSMEVVLDISAWETESFHGVRNDRHRLRQPDRRRLRSLNPDWHRAVHAHLNRTYAIRSDPSTSSNRNTRQVSRQLFDVFHGQV